MYCFNIIKNNGNIMQLIVDYKFNGLNNLEDNLRKMNTKESLNILNQIKSIMYFDVVPYLKESYSDSDIKYCNNLILKRNIFEEYNFAALASFNLNEVLTFLKENNEDDAFNYFRNANILRGINAAQDILEDQIKVTVKKWENVLLNSSFYALLDLRSGFYIANNESRVASGTAHLNNAKLFNNVEHANNFRERFTDKFSIVEVEMNVKPVVIPENVINAENPFHSIMSKRNIENALKEDNINLDVCESIKNKRKM